MLSSQQNGQHKLLQISNRKKKKRKKNISIEMQRKSKEAVVRARALVIRTFQRQTVGQSSKHIHT
jgi:hypothetical protein